LKRFCSTASSRSKNINVFLNKPLYSGKLKSLAEKFCAAHFPDGLTVFGVVGFVVVVGPVVVPSNKT
jgi:hypothetical protein